MLEKMVKIEVGDLPESENYQDFPRKLTTLTKAERKVFDFTCRAIAPTICLKCCDCRQS